MGNNNVLPDKLISNRPILYWVNPPSLDTEEENFIQKYDTPDQSVSIVRYGSDEEVLKECVGGVMNPIFISKVVYSHNAQKSALLVNQYIEVGVYVACNVSDLIRLYYNSLEIPLKKLSDNLKINSVNSKYAVIMLSGSFNPIHCAHAEILNKARTHLETKEGYTVICGYLAPSSNAYVTSKLGDEAMSLQHRNLLAKLLCYNSSWIEVLPWGLASSERTSGVIQTRLSQLYPQHTIRVFELCGADHAAKYSLWKYYTSKVNLGYMICIGRSPDTDKVREGLKLDIYDQFVLVEDCAGEISSTEIRKLMSEKNWDKLREPGYLTNPILDYLHSIEENRSFLYTTI